MKKNFFNLVKIKLNIVLSLFLLVVIIVPLFSGCSDKKKENNLKIYTLKNIKSDLAYVIEEYNKYCSKNLDDSYKIQVIEFESEDEMNTKISTEVMAGEGPDVFSLDQKLPFEKLMENGAFADINELANEDISNNKINFKEYNSVIMNVGVWNGKRYIVPLSYGVNVLITTEKRLNNFDISIKNGSCLTYDQISDTFNTFFKNPSEYSFIFNEDNFSWHDYANQLFYKFIDSHIDYKNKTTSFNTTEFSRNIDSMINILNNSKKYNGKYDIDKVLFDDLYVDYSLSSVLKRYNYYISEKDNPLILNGFNIYDDSFSAYVTQGIAINKNTKLTDKAYNFIKFALSDKIQRKIGEDVEDVGTVNLPVKTQSYNYTLDNTSNLTDDNNKIIGIDNDFFKAYLNIIDNVNECSFYIDISHSYYNSCVIGDIVDKYLNGEISKEKFIRQLTSATEIYLTE